MYISQQEDQKPGLAVHSSSIVVLLNSLVSSTTPFASFTPASCSGYNIANPAAQTFPLLSFHSTLDVSIARWVNVQARNSIIGSELTSS
jgi:hypothetical protein